MNRQELFYLYGSYIAAGHAMDLAYQKAMDSIAFFDKKFNKIPKVRDNHRPTKDFTHFDAPDRKYSPF